MPATRSASQGDVIKVKVRQGGNVHLQQCVARSASSREQKRRAWRELRGEVVLFTLALACFLSPDNLPLDVLGRAAAGEPTCASFNIATEELITRHACVFTGALEVAYRHAHVVHR